MQKADQFLRNGNRIATFASRLPWRHISFFKPCTNRFASVVDEKWLWSLFSLVYASFLSIFLPSFSIYLCVCPLFHFHIYLHNNVMLSTPVLNSLLLLHKLFSCVSLMAKHLHNERWGEMIADIFISHAVTFYGMFQHVLHQRYMAREIISPCPPSQSQISVNLSSFFFAT